METRCLKLLSRHEESNRPSRRNTSNTSNTSNMPFKQVGQLDHFELFQLSKWRAKCMHNSVSRCGPMPSGDLPCDPTPTDLSAKCRPVYTDGGYTTPFPPYLMQSQAHCDNAGCSMRSDNRFLQRQDFPNQTFLSAPVPGAEQWSPMSLLYGTHEHHTQK